MRYVLTKNVSFGEAYAVLEEGGSQVYSVKHFWDNKMPFIDMQGQKLISIEMRQPLHVELCSNGEPVARVTKNTGWLKTQIKLGIVGQPMCVIDGNNRVYYLHQSDRCLARVAKEYWKGGLRVETTDDVEDQILLCTTIVIDHLIGGLGQSAE